VVTPAAPSVMGRGASSEIAVIVRTYGSTLAPHADPTRTVRPVVGMVGSTEARPAWRTTQWNRGRSLVPRVGRKLRLIGVRPRPSTGMSVIAATVLCATGEAWEQSPVDFYVHCKTGWLLITPTTPNRRCLIVTSPAASPELRRAVHEWAQGPECDWDDRPSDFAHKLDAAVSGV